MRRRKRARERIRTRAGPRNRALAPRVIITQQLVSAGTAASVPVCFLRSALRPLQLNVLRANIFADRATLAYTRGERERERERKTDIVRFRNAVLLDPCALLGIPRTSSTAKCIDLTPFLCLFLSSPPGFLILVLKFLAFAMLPLFLVRSIHDTRF